MTIQSAVCCDSTTHCSCRADSDDTTRWNAGVASSPVVKPGLGITAITRCIWFGGLPSHVGEAVLFKEASLMGDVQSVVFPDCPGRDEALVTFASFGYDTFTIFVVLPNRHHQETESALVASDDRLLTAFPAMHFAFGVAVCCCWSLHA